MKTNKKKESKFDVKARRSGQRECAKVASKRYDNEVVSKKHERDEENCHTLIVGAERSNSALANRLINLEGFIYGVNSVKVGRGLQD